MEFRTVLLRMEVCGMKNIQNPLSFDFVSVATNRKKINLKDSNVKAIFAENGAGKSALMHAVDIYKKVIFNYAYFSNQAARDAFVPLINKVTKQLIVKMYFAICIDDEIKKIYAHELVIGTDGKQVSVIDEKISVFTKRSLNSPTDTIIEFANGKMVGDLAYKEDPLYNYILENMRAAFGVSSLISFFSNPSKLKGIVEILSNKSIAVDQIKNGREIFSMVVDVFAFGLSLSICLSKEDIHSQYDIETIQEIINKYNKQGNLISLNVITNDDVIHKRQLKEYTKYTEKLFEFIKVFKDDLVSIEIEKQIDGAYYHVSRVFHYKDYSVDYEYESTGIKRLVRMFGYFENAANGGIAFIDEIDANINDVYLKKLVEYFVNYGKGQLIFTTHNTSPMHVLKKKKNGIDFINTSQNVISWITNGNYAPESQYRSGMLQNLPFNVEPFDFIRCFSREE